VSEGEGESVFEFEFEGGPRRAEGGARGWRTNSSSCR
jgi:hypothetical protein